MKIYKYVAIIKGSVHGEVVADNKEDALKQLEEYEKYGNPCGLNMGSFDVWEAEDVELVDDEEDS